MRSLVQTLLPTILLASSLASHSAFAASYERTDGTSWGIACRYGGFGCEYTGEPHPYPGPDLESGVDASGADLRHANLDDAQLDGANLSFADFTRSSFDSADLSSANLRGASLWDAVLNSANLDGADMTGADLFSVTITGGATMINAIFAQANLDGARIWGIATNADFRDAIMTRSHLGASDLSGADLRGADLTDSIYLGMVIGSPIYDSQTNFTNATSGHGGPLFDPVAAGWTFVPEPSAALMIGLGLAGLAKRRPEARSGSRSA